MSFILKPYLIIIIISLSFYSASYKSLCALQNIQINEKSIKLTYSIALNYTTSHYIQLHHETKMIT